MTLSKTAQLEQIFEAISERIPADAKTSAAEKEVNLPKNRYQTTLPYDFNRVVVDELGPSFYFNGSFLDSETIATQGPLPSTVGDFLNVVWHLDVRLVIQLTQCEYADADYPDKLLRKSHPYWPSEVGVPTSIADLQARDLNGNELRLEAPPNGNFPKFTLTKVKETKDGDVIWRELRIETDGGEKKTFIHLHYRGWPNGGVPTNGQRLIDFVQIVEKLLEELKSTLLTAKVMMHCSGGVGRTGSFIVLQMMLQEFSKGELPDVTTIFKFVRSRRMQSVDNKAQFEWLHNIADDLVDGRLEIRSPETSYPKIFGELR